MAYPNGRFGYRQAPSDAEVNRKPPGYFNEDDSNILESALLDSDIMQNADAAHVGKSSYAHAHGMLSPNEPHVWPPQYAGPVRMEPASVGNATPYHDHHYSFNREHAPQPAPFGHPAHPHGWAYDQRSGNCTPTSRMDFEQQPPAASFEVPQYHHQRTDSARGSFSHPHQHLALHRPDESFIPAPPVQTPMSPHSHQDWMNLAAQEVEHRPMSRRMRGQSPPQTTIDLQRRDGIRKKNARIDIPHERSIQTIEQLLETTTDEEILKELKQQKRLLRNREAA